VRQKHDLPIRGGIVAAWTLQERNWAPFPYLGPLVPAAPWPQARQALDDDRRRNGIGLIGFGLAPDDAVERDALRAMLL